MMAKTVEIPLSTALVETLFLVSVRGEATASDVADGSVDLLPAAAFGARLSVLLQLGLVSRRRQARKWYYSLTTAGKAAL